MLSFPHDANLSWVGTRTIFLLAIEEEDDRRARAAAAVTP